MFSEPPLTSDPLLSAEPDILSLFQANSATLLGQDFTSIKGISNVSLDTAQYCLVFGLVFCEFLIKVS